MAQGDLQEQIEFQKLPETASKMKDFKDAEQRLREVESKLGEFDSSPEGRCSSSVDRGGNSWSEGHGFDPRARSLLVGLVSVLFDRLRQKSWSPNFVSMW